MPTPEVPSRMQQAGSLAAGAARLTGKGLYNTAKFGADAMDTLFAPEGTLGSAYQRATGPPAWMTSGSSGNKPGWERLKQRKERQQRQTASSGTRLAGGGYMLGDTVMRNRDRPVDSTTLEMEDAAHAAAVAPRPALRDYETTNTTGAPRRWRMPSATDIVSSIMPAVTPYPWER